MAEQVFRTVALVGGGLPCVGCVDENGVIYDTSEPVYLHSVGCVTEDGDIYNTPTKTLGGLIGRVNGSGEVFDAKQGFGFGSAVAVFQGNDLLPLYKSGIRDSVRVGYTNSSSVYAHGAAAFFFLTGKMGEPREGYNYALDSMNAPQTSAPQTNTPVNTSSTSTGSGSSGNLPVGCGIPAWLIIIVALFAWYIIIEVDSGRGGPLLLAGIVLTISFGIGYLLRRKHGTLDNWIHMAKYKKQLDREFSNKTTVNTNTSAFANNVKNTVNNVQQKVSNVVSQQNTNNFVNNPVLEELVVPERRTVMKSANSSVPVEHVMWHCRCGNLLNYPANKGKVHLNCPYCKRTVTVDTGNPINNPVTASNASTNAPAKSSTADPEQKIVDWMAESFKAQNGIDLRNDGVAVQRMKEAATKAWVELANNPTTTISLPFITAGPNGPLHLALVLTKEQFEDLIKNK